MDWTVRIPKIVPQNSSLRLIFVLLLLSNVPDGTGQIPDTDEKVDFTCPDQFGYYPDKNNCSRYFVCVFGLAVHESCTGGLYFSTDLQTCDWPRNVMCNQGSGERSNASDSGVTATTSTISTIKIIDPRTTKTTPASTTAIQPATAAPTPQPQPRRVPNYSTLTSISTGWNPTSTHTPLGSPVINKPNIEQATIDPLQGKKDSDIQHATEEDELRTLTELYDVLRDNKKPSAKCLNCQVPPRTTTPSGQDEEGGMTYQQDESAHHTERQHNLPIGVTGGKGRAQNAHNNQVEVANFGDRGTGSDYGRTVVVHEADLTSSEQATLAEYPASNEEGEDSRDVEQTDYSAQVGDAEYTEPPEEDQESPETPYVEPTTKPIHTSTSALPTSHSSPPQPDMPARRCDPNVCQLPKCFCGGNRVVPGGLKPEDIPQIVLIAFDDAINEINWSLYESLFYKGRKNPNGCPILATFYVSHEWTDYSKVQTLYSDGHEIASHSITHPTDADSFTTEQWYQEIVGQKEILSRYAAIRPEEIRGMRAPFLQIGGNEQYAMLSQNNFTYDSSMPVYENRPPYWPYTLDYSVSHECMITPCPNHAFPGIWEVPLVMWVDNNGGRCSMADACAHPPTAEGVYTMMVKNFERHYSTNRAPFGLFYHAGWFATPHHREGFEAFLNQLVTMEDVYIVTMYQLIQWLRNPTPLAKIKNFEPWQCHKQDRGPPCKKPNVCNLWHKGGVRYMRTCQPCPSKYPWVETSANRTSTR